MCEVRFSCFICCSDTVLYHFTPSPHHACTCHSTACTRLYSKVLFILPSQSAFFKTLSLETLLTRADTLPNLYQELKAKGFLALLEHR